MKSILFLQNTFRLNPRPQRFYSSAPNVNRFFKSIGLYKNVTHLNGIPSFIKDKRLLNQVFGEIISTENENYIYTNFTHWLSNYAATNPPSLTHYFSNQTNFDLNDVCKEFSTFCFKNNISLSKEETLKAFSHHDELSDQAVKGELLSKLSPKKVVHLLGFGLGNGYYEKSIAQYLIEKRLAESVKIFGFDPYPEITPDIEFITSQQLEENSLHFDIVTARWVLHHVELKQRWDNFSKCINRVCPNGIVLIIEHGFLSQHTSPFNKKIYYLLNATFDVIANIGIRPHWFTSTAPDIGANFYVHYLKPADFDTLRTNSSINITQNLYEVGPDFPNQTLCCMKIR